MTRNNSFIRISKETKAFIEKLKIDLSAIERNPKISSGEVIRRITRLPSLANELEKDSFLFKRRKL